MNAATSAWLLYSWFEENGVDCIHPEDIIAFRELQPNGRLFQLVGSDAGYIVLQHAGRRYRVTPALARPVAAPVFGYGDTVVATSGGASRRATVREIFWHFQRNEPFYLLDVVGCRSTRRYWSNEIQAG